MPQESHKEDTANKKIYPIYLFSHLTTRRQCFDVEQRGLELSSVMGGPLALAKVEYSITTTTNSE